MAYRRRNPRVRKMKKIMRKGKAKGMLAMIRQVASKVLIRKAETKYVANQPYVDTPVTGTLTAPTGFLPCLPMLGSGSESYQRNGSRISNVRGRTIFTFWLDNTTQSANCDNISVKIFTVESKQIKAAAQLPYLPPNKLLDNGDGTTTDWSNPTAGFPLQYDQLPISNENYRGKTKTLRLVKNTGGPNAIGGNVVSPNTYGRIMVKYVYHWRRKSNLVYDGLAPSVVAGFPTNWCPLFGVVAYLNDSSAKLADNTVYMNVRNEMYFKDV